MEANKRNVTHVFGQPIQFVVPLFQRPYVWEKESSWEPLWEHVQGLADRRVEGGEAKPHFLGAVVLDQLPTPTGAVETRQIIDGQQRLTTLQLFLAAARDVAKFAGAENHSKAFEQLVHNELPLSERLDDQFKVWPTNVDQDHFRRTMLAGSPEELRRAADLDNSSDSACRIPQAYLFFYDTVLDWATEQEGSDLIDRLDKLYRAVQQDVLFVVIDLDEKDDAQIIFETLNALGTPLLPADLVKNFLFHAAQGEGWPIEDLYTDYWLPFDRDEAFWREEVRQGRLKRPRIDLFLQHYLTLATNDEVVVTHLFTTFRDHVRSMPNLTAGDHLSSLAEYGEVFRRLSSFPPESPEGTFFYRLDLLETSTVYPFLLELFKQEYSRDRAAVRQILRDLESFLVRRLVCRLTTKNYNRLFLDLVQRAREQDRFTVSNVRSFLLELTGDSTRWPRDEEFETSWMQQPMYKSLVRRRVRMLLEALDGEMYSDKTEALLFSKDLTVEHLMPQAWEDHWALPGEAPVEAETERRAEIIHTIGNLTLLTKKLNPAISNGPWLAKRRKIRQFSALNLNLALMGEERWTEADIERRSLELFTLAMRIWPHPEGPTS